MELITSKTINTLLISDTGVEGYQFVHAIIKVTSENEALYYSNISEDDSSTALTSDGCYKGISIRLPLSSSNQADYYINDNKIYQNGIQISIADLLEVNEVGTNFEGYKDTKYIVSVYYINKNFVTIEQEVLNLTTQCKTDSGKTRLRDILYMGLSVIDYLLEQNMYGSANLIVEQLTNCSIVYVNPCHW